jgi:PAS domain S-box-containing protein
MHPYLLLIALSCLLCAGAAGCVFANRPSHRPNQLAATLLLGVAFWAMCEIFWNLSADRESALQWVRLATFGWAFIGPVFLHLIVHSFPKRGRRFRRAVPALYALSAGWVVLGLTTPLITADVVKVAWGWGYLVGPGLLVAYATSMIPVIVALGIVALDFRRESSPAERRQAPWMVVATAFPLSLCAVTDVALPALGIQVPRLGTTSFAVMGIVAVWTLLRFGYSFMAPGTFAHEILATLPEGVALVQRDERISSANQGLANLCGIHVDSLAGMHVPDILVRPDHDETRDDDDSGSVLLRAALTEYECHLLHSSGERIPVAISSSVLRDRQEFLIGVVLVVRDQRVVAGLRSRLVTSARLAAVGELAAGIAHEINNPIAFVRTNLSQLQAHWKTIRAAFEAPDSAQPIEELFVDGEEMIEESLEGVGRAAEIVRGVQGFSHRGGDEREPADINLLLEEVLRMADTQLRGRATIERIYDDLPLVYCSPQELKQVFLNLIVNAGHAIGERGTIRIRTESRVRSVEIRVDDDGCGIAPEIIERIFDPFFTTKAVGDGTGLGLGIAYQIVRSHGGELSAVSNADSGTSFRVQIPVGKAKPAAA